MASFIKKLNLSNLEQKTSKRSYSEAFGDDEKSPISILMEYAQKKGFNPPEFRWLEAEKNNVSQECIFTCYVKLNSRVEAIGKGSTKKKAKHVASQNLLTELEKLGSAATKTADLNQNFAENVIQTNKATTVFVPQLKKMETLKSPLIIVYDLEFACNQQYGEIFQIGAVSSLDDKFEVNILPKGNIDWKIIHFLKMDIDIQTDSSSGERYMIKRWIHFHFNAMIASFCPETTK